MLRHEFNCVKVARVVFRNVIFNFASLVIGNISGLFLVIIIARILKPEYFGIYSLTIAIANVLIAITNLGIDGAVIRYTAYFSKDILRVRSHLRYFLKIKVFLGFSVSTILFFVSDKLANVFGDERLALTFAVASLIVVFASLTNVLNSFFMGLQKFRYTFFRQIVYEISRWILILPLSIVFLAVGAILGTALAYLVAFLFLVIVLLKFYQEYFVGGVENISEGVKSFMGFMTIASISGIIYAYVDSIMIGYLLTPTDVGYYRAAYSIVFAIVGLIASLRRVLLPTFTQLSINDINISLERLVRYSSIIAFPSAFLISYFSRDIVELIYGTDYLNAYYALTFLSFAIIPGAFNYLVTIFNAKERADISAFIVTSSIILNVVLNYFLIIRMGIAGAAIATVISRLFVIALSVFLLFRLFGIALRASSILKPLISSLAMLFVLILLPEPSSLTVGIMKVVFSGIVYILILFGVRGIVVDDLRYFRDIIK